MPTGTGFALPLSLATNPPPGSNTWTLSLPPVRHVYVALAVDRNVGRPAQFAVAAAGTTVGGHVIPVRRKSLDTVVAPVRDVDLAPFVHGQSPTAG